MSGGKASGWKLLRLLGMVGVTKLLQMKYLKTQKFHHPKVSQSLKNMLNRLHLYIHVSNLSIFYHYEKKWFSLFT